MGNLQSTDAATLPQPSQVQLPKPDFANKTITQTVPDQMFPYTNSIGRLSDYQYFNNLLLGQHFEAFNIRVNSNDYSASYGKLRYVTINFAGLLSKVIADMLFSEPISIKASDQGDQDWIDAFVESNHLNEQLYESAVSNSALGDGIFKLRVGKRMPDDDDPTIILEDTTPTIFFPHLDGFNVRAVPECMELAWSLTYNKTMYMRQELHYPDRIESHLFEMKDGKIMEEVNLDLLGIPDLTGVGMIQETNINRYMLIHIPNWKTGNRFFGISDYYDLDRIFYAINNRITKIDNILDKHSDPILMIPDGVLDEKGRVNRGDLHMIEVPESTGAGKQKPEYIVWNANLEAAFMQVDKIMNFFMMTAEITPDILGMGEGLNDSGRALKFKLMRTIAKAMRKKLYYDRAIKEIIYVAQLLAKEWDLGIGDKNIKLKGEPEHPDIIWQDGLPIDDYEQVTNEVAKIDAGLQSKKQAIMNLDNIDAEAAEEKLEDIDKENPIEIPIMANQTGNFNKNPNGGSPQINTPKPKVNDNANPKTTPAKKVVK